LKRAQQVGSHMTMNEGLTSLFAAAPQRQAEKGEYASMSTSRGMGPVGCAKRVSAVSLQKTLPVARILLNFPENFDSLL
jgi:hypothetical protein